MSAVLDRPDDGEFAHRIEQAGRDLRSQKLSLTQQGAIMTRIALEEGCTVMHCNGRCTYCGGPSTRTMRLEKIAGKWSRVQVDSCTNSLAGLSNPKPPDRRCPDVRTVV